MAASKSGALVASGSFEAMYPSIGAAYKSNYGKSPVSSSIWIFFHELHLLQTAQAKTDIDDAAWALFVFTKATTKLESRRGTDMVQALIRGLPTKEHEAWYAICVNEGFMDVILSAHPHSGSNVQDPESAAKSSLAVGVIQQDFQGRWSALLTWQREFMYSEVWPKCGEVFREAQQVVNVMDRRCFSLVLAKLLIRAGYGTVALKLLRLTPVEELCETPEYGQPREKHSYFALYTQFLLYGDAEDAIDYLEHLVMSGAYSDLSFATFLQIEQLNNVVSFAILFVSLVRQRQSGVLGGEEDLNERRRCCRIWAGKARLQVPLQTSNVPFLLLQALLDKYGALEGVGREHLVHGKTFQQALEVVLLLSESEMIVRMADRLSVAHQGFLRTCLHEWARLHFLRVLDMNRPPIFNPTGHGVQWLLTSKEMWTWRASEGRSQYFKSGARDSEDIAVVLCMFFELNMFLEPTNIKRLIQDAFAMNPPLPIFDLFLPEDSDLFDALSMVVSMHSVGLKPSEVKVLMRSSAFYEPGIQAFLSGGQVEEVRAVFHENMAFVRLLQAVARLFSFRNGHMERHALESSLGQIVTACHGDTSCRDMMVCVIDATLMRKDLDFLPAGSQDRESDPSAFTVASLAICARRLREASDTVRNQTVQVTFGRVVSAFLETPPRGWVPLFNSLETVLFFLRFMEREDLGLAYNKFESENCEDDDSSTMRKLVTRAKQYYKEPLIDLQSDLTELCNLDLRSKLAKRLLPSKRKSTTEGSKFENADWNNVVEIALCAAESMKEKYNVPMLPHHTQMITLLVFAIQACQGSDGRAGGGGPKTMLAKVGTGEGKSWIIGMLAAFIAKRGARAHVIIDNDTLLERDFATMSALFKKLGLRAEKRQMDESNQIVYCSAMDIEIHTLKTMQDESVGVKSRSSNCVMIVDEVDSLIVDENVYTCYVDDYWEGCEVSEWWWHEGRHANTADLPSWKQKIISNCKVAESELRSKREGKHYVTDYNAVTFWALDERTSQVKRSVWFLWLELLRKQKLTDYEICYTTRQSVICKQSCFASYAFIFGLTGSLGTEAERKYTKKHFNASFLHVPSFLDTCRGQSRPRPRCTLVQMESNARSQLECTVETVRKHCESVPMLVVVKDVDRVQKVVEKIREELPFHADGDRLGPGVIELLDKPGKEGEFQQMVQVATQPLDAGPASSIRRWRVTVTTAVGARGQDYSISDELVDEKGGFLLILEYIPDSEREWIQFLGRTARHDHPGQYAVVLNAEDYHHVFGPGGVSEDVNCVRAILDHENKANEQKLVASEIQIERGFLMHRFTRQFWSWAAKHKDHENYQDIFGQWVELCERFEEKDPSEISKAFAAMDLDIPPEPEPVKNLAASGGRAATGHDDVGEGSMPTLRSSNAGRKDDNSGGERQTDGGKQKNKAVMEKVIIPKAANGRNDAEDDDDLDGLFTARHSRPIGGNSARLKTTPRPATRATPRSGSMAPIGEAVADKTDKSALLS
eukprot:TRINITY_DN15383_c0_g1_i1.p1 TRINITY_DN15383_c0_g1~~TRINITY_DN15383_c0_g1_i1.p1  ORF type:complete len:1496 (+),score=249.05 TRINITY_DN15383_c0_g1_i1:150-4637(+)